MIYSSPIFRLLGDRALLVELGEGIDPGLNRLVFQLFSELDRRRRPGTIDLIPSYCAVLVVYDPLTVTLSDLRSQVAETLETMKDVISPNPRTVEIPVIYGGGGGPDLEWLADFHGLDPQEVIRIHSSVVYQVYMIGFTPGFPYMGEVPSAIATPRLDKPRTQVPKGSVAIANRQAGIYPVESPGGWRIIGFTPLTLFNPAQNPPALLQMGDLVRFIPVTGQEAEKWA